jgi:gentisate 1,2-dioxygenase
MKITAEVGYNTFKLSQRDINNSPQWIDVEISRGESVCFSFHITPNDFRELILLFKAFGEVIEDET